MVVVVVVVLLLLPPLLLLLLLLTLVVPRLLLILHRTAALDTLLSAEYSYLQLFPTATIMAMLICNMVFTIARGSNEHSFPGSAY